MSAILFDGFDHADTIDVWTVHNGARVTSTKRTGTASWKVNVNANSDYNTYRDLGPSEEDDVITVGFGFFAQNVFNQMVLQLADKDASSGTGLTHIGLYFRASSRAWELWWGTEFTASGKSGGKLVETVPNVALIGSWHYMELQVVVANSGGRATLRQDGVEILEYTGDTERTGTAIVDRVAFTSRTNGLEYLIDDVYILNEQGSVNNDFLADTRVYPLYPNGNGNYSQLVGSDGNSTDNYLLVDEPGAPSAADYVGSATPGDKDSYTFEDLPVTLGTIRGVETRIVAAKTNTGTKQIRAITRRGGADSFGADHVLSDSAYVTFRDVYELDPHAGPGAWTITNVNGTEWGAEVRS